MTERLTAQEWFDKTVGHLRTMSGQAIDSAGHCLYLTPDGNKCAIGVHIPDGHPGQREEVGLRRLIRDHHPDLAAVILPCDMPPLLAEELAEEMQQLHDHCGNWSGDQFIGEYELAEVAEDFNLVYSPPT